MVLSDHSLISLLFLVWWRNIYSEWILNLHLAFWKQKLSDVSLKAFAFEILQLLGFFLGKEIICSCIWRCCLWWKYVMRWLSVFMGFKVKGSRKSLRFCLRKIVSFWILILSAWIIMSSFFSMSWLLWKKYSSHFESLVYCSRLLTCLIRKDFYRHVM
jgi:hypothetical protein